MTIPDWMIDKRVVDRYLRKGMLDAKEYDKLIKAIPDRADNAEPMGDDDGDDEDEDGDEE